MMTSGLTRSLLFSLRFSQLKTGQMLQSPLVSMVGGDRDGKCLEILGLGRVINDFYLGRLSWLPFFDACYLSSHL